MRWTKFFRAIAIGAAAVAAGVSGAAAAEDAPPPDDGRAAVLAELEAYYADLSARDWDAFSAHFWPGATIATVWRPPGADAPAVMVATVPEFVAKAAEGPGGKPIFEEWMTSSRIEITGGLAQVWAGYAARFGEVGDVVEANLRLTEAALPAARSIDDRGFNVGTGAETSVTQLARTLQHIAGREAPLNFAAARPGELRYSSLDASRLRSLGWSPATTLVDGLRRTYEWIAEQEAEHRDRHPVRVAGEGAEHSQSLAEQAP